MKEKRHLRRLFRGSAILSTLDRAAAFLYRKAGASIIGHLLTKKQTEHKQSTRFKFKDVFKDASAPEKVRTVRRTVSRWMERSFILEKISRFINSLVCTRMKVYGWFLLSFGFYSAASYFVRYFAIDEMTHSENIYTLYSSVVIMILSLPLLLSKGTLISSMRSNRLTYLLLTKVIGFREVQFESLNDKKGRSNIAFILGILLGIFSNWVNPIVLLLGVIAVAILYTILIVPEFGIVLTFFIFPLAQISATAVLVLYTTACYALKLIRGKRTFKLSTADTFVLIFMGIILFGGLVSVSHGASTSSALLFVCLMLGYFTTVNLVNTTDLLKRSTTALLISSAIVAIYGVFQAFFSSSSTASAFFADSSVLAEYIIILVPFAFASFLSSDNGKKRFSNFLAVAIMIVCLVLTHSSGSWVGVLVGLFVFFLFVSRRTLIVLCFGAVATPFAIYFFPELFKTQASSIGNMADITFSKFASIWSGVCNMLKDCFFTGIGFGQDAFSQVYPLYASQGSEGIAHSYNLLLEITVELGVVALAVFVIFILVFIKNSISFAYNNFDKHQKLYTYAGISSIVAILVRGITDYVWIDSRIFLAFWLIIALTSAYRRVGIVTLKGNPISQNDAGAAHIDINI